MLAVDRFNFQSAPEAFAPALSSDSTVAPSESMIALYGESWSIETFNREVQAIYQVERFRSITAERVEQELYACLT